MRIKGWKNVFAFTFVQQIKTKSFIIGTVVIVLIVALIAALANILPALFLSDAISDMDSSGGSDALTVEKLYISNSTGYDFDFSELTGSMGITQENITQEQAQSKINELETSSENAMLAMISLDEETGFMIESYYAGGESNVSKDDCTGINSALSGSLKAQYLMLAGLSAEDLPLAMSSVSVSLAEAGEEPVGLIRGIVNSVVPMLSSLVLFIFIFSYSQLVAQAVAIEKSSRIMEYLLTSIKPLAIIMGKVLAMCTVSLLQFICIFLGGVLGFLVSMPFGIFSKMEELTQMAQGMGAADMGIETKSIINDIVDVFSSVNASAIIVMILTFVLGFLFFALMAGLAGASVSKMEDLAGAMQPLSIVGVLGFYLAYFPQVTAVDGDNMMMVVARYLPISSPFILTSDYMLGKISFIETCIPIVLLIAADIAMMMLVAKVYEHIVLHTGDRLKIADMLKLAENNKGK